MRFLLPLFIILISITSCQSLPMQPSWIENPEEGAVGSSTTHIRGRHYQEELAIARARERLAARYGVKIDSIQTISEKVKNDSAYVTSEKESQQIIQGQTIRARVREVWYDQINDTIWVWVYPIK